MTTRTTAEIWLGKINSGLSRPIEPGSREDEIAYDAYVAGKSIDYAIHAVEEFRLAHVTAAIARAVKG